MDVAQERSGKWGKWKPTVFNGASNEGGPSAPPARADIQAMHEAYCALPEHAPRYPCLRFAQVKGRLTGMR